MKRMLLIAALALSLSLVLASGAMAQTGPKTTGGGTWESGFNQTVTGSVIMQDPWPDTNARVRLTVDDHGPANNDYAYRGIITCYFQAGNDSRFSGQITSGQGDDAADGFFIWAVHDGGGRQGEGDLVRTKATQALQDCNDPSFQPRNPVAPGANFRVHQP